MGNAVAAILVVEGDRYLMQLRDDIPEIWYPGHWGLFGGGIDVGEDEIEALRRELREEIGFDLDPCRTKLFTRFDFDLRPAGLGRYLRSYYEVPISTTALADLSLHEGADMRAFTGKEALALRLSPYDGFALFMHYHRDRLEDALPASFAGP
jgi:8-oxo-dGTP pyrophosphatase MutT (NUDIX family)